MQADPVKYALMAFLVLISGAAHAGSTFEERMLNKPAIAQPQEPFVLIFFHGGGDDTPYGFVVDGTMHQSDWRKVLAHVGYLSPYSIFKPRNTSRWRNHGFDVPVRAAQAMGRPTGGSIMGLPSDKAEAHNVLTAYSDPLGLNMTHFFHDDEKDLGIPGGHGKTRLMISANGHGAYLAGRLAGPPGNDSGVPLGRWTLRFGADFGDYVFGGQTTVMGNDMDHGGGDGRVGWRVMFINTGGYNGHSNIVFATRGGEYVKSAPLSARQALRWLTVDVTVSADPSPRYDDVRISIDGVGTSSGRIERARYYGGTLFVGDPHGQTRSVRYDDITLGAPEEEGSTVMARYTFEAAGSGQGRMPGKVRDVSGRGQDLTAAGDDIHALGLEPTSGIEPGVFRRVRHFLVDALLQSRSAHGRPPPALITNWRLDDEPGRFGQWKAAGFTNGSTAYYLAGDLPQGESPVEYILHGHTLATQWAWQDGSHWTHAWLGQTTVRESTLTPKDYRSLVTLAVLDGNRWFSVFTAMSRGRLGQSGLSRREQAVVNADALYDMATAAGWFQGTAEGLRDSVYVGQDPLVDRLPHGVFRARENESSKELWFAAYRPDGPERRRLLLKVKLPSKRGTVTDLATGKRHTVAHGVFEFPVSADTEPYYFSPAAKD